MKTRTLHSKILKTEEKKHSIIVISVHLSVNICKLYFLGLKKICTEATSFPGHCLFQTGIGPSQSQKVKGPGNKVGPDHLVGHLELFIRRILILSFIIQLLLYKF